jgi:hypothetical protein
MEWRRAMARSRRGRAVAGWPVRPAPRPVPAGQAEGEQPAALPLDLVDVALAVVFAAALEGKQFRVPRERLECCQHVSYRHALSVASQTLSVRRGRSACLGIRFSVGCALIIRLIIQTIVLDPSGAVWTDEPSNVSSLDPSGAIQIDAEHPTRNRKVVGSAVALTMLVDLQARSRPVAACHRARRHRGE